MSPEEQDATAASAEVGPIRRLRKAHENHEEKEKALLATGKLHPVPSGCAAFLYLFNLW